MNAKKIVIVDFDEKSIDPLSEYLEEQGYKILVAKDGESGLEMCKAEQPDLVILEPMLPKLHGFELCSIITKDMEPKIPVIILTKFYKEQQFKIESTRSFGASAFLSKPFDKTELQSHLAELLPQAAGKEQESVEEAEIPNSFSAETLQNLEENLEKEEAKVQKNQEQEQEIFETSPVEEAPAPSSINSENLSQEIDDMLKDTLSDFGLDKSEKKPALKSEEQEIEKPQIESPPEDKVTSAIEELKSEVNIEAKMTPEVEEPNLPKVEEEAVPEEKDTAAKIENEFIQQFEASVASVKSDPPSEKIEAEEEVVEPAVEEKPPAEGAATESFFNEYGALEEKPSFFKKVMDKIKSMPPKLLVPIVTAFVVLIIASVFMLRPKKSDNASVQQASLGVPSIQKTVDDPPAGEIQEAIPSKDDDLTSTEDQGNLQSEENPAKTEADTIQEPPEKPQPKPKSQTTRPPYQPLTAETGAENTIQPQVVGEAAAPPIEENPTEKTSADEQSDPQAEGQSLSSQPGTPPANQVQTGDLVPIQQVDEAPIVLKRILPEYPAAARNMQVTGTILISALIDERGNVVKTAVIRGIKGPFGLNEASEEAVKQWRFKPATKDGVNVKVWKQIPISFQKDN